MDIQLDTSSGTTTLTRDSIVSFTPLWHNVDTEVGFTSYGEAMMLGEELPLPSTGDLLPDMFGALDFGPTVRHKFSNEWILGANVLAGASSNKPFANFNTLDATGNISLVVPGKASGAWVFFLNYSSNRDFWRHIPLPAAAYAFNKGWGRGVVGIPIINLSLMPRSRINFTLRYFPIIRTYADIGWNPRETIRLAGFFQWEDDHYWRTGRAIDNRQIFYVEKTLGASAWFRVYKDIDLKLNAGWRFNRYFFEGRSIIKDTDYNRINLDTTPFAGIEITARM